MTTCKYCKGTGQILLLNSMVDCDCRRLDSKDCQKSKSGGSSGGSGGGIFNGCIIRCYQNGTFAGFRIFLDIANHHVLYYVKQDRKTRIATMPKDLFVPPYKWVDYEWRIYKQFVWKGSHYEIERLVNNSDPSLVDIYLKGMGKLQAGFLLESLDSGDIDTYGTYC